MDAQALSGAFLMVSAFGNVTLHGFCTVAYLRGYRWAALVLSVALALGVLASLLIMLTVAALLGTLNGAPSQDVELLLSSASPLYTPVYIAGPYMLVCVVALALVWSRQSRYLYEARRDWRLRRSRDLPDLAHRFGTDSGCGAGSAAHR